MSATEPSSATTPLNGGCACGEVGYRLLEWPMFVHCCHCTRCQHETGGPFAHHAMVEFSRFEVTQGEADFVLVPTDSGGKHWVARCPGCRTAMWNEHGSRRAVTRCVRGGTMDQPQALPPLAHIFGRSRQTWLMLDSAVPVFAACYDAAKTWPQASLARYEAARALRAEQARVQRAVPRPRGPQKTKGPRIGGP